MAKSMCDFCCEFSGNSENSFGRIYGGNPGSRILFQSSNFAVIPSLGQVVEGYLLVVPKQHFPAIGDLPPTSLMELAAIVQLAGKILKSAHGPCIFFEHGTRCEGVGGCGIYHAHLHATPLAGASDPVGALKETFPFTELDQFTDIAKQSAGLSTYLFYKSWSGRFYLFDTGPLPSQYMRRLLADALGSRDWDWRFAGREARLLATLERLSGTFDNTKEFSRAPSP
jgi:diadenosine tetraphosphate (Ap4A) HIT family hydrolase